MALPPSSTDTAQLRATEDMFSGYTYVMYVLLLAASSSGHSSAWPDVLAILDMRPLQLPWSPQQGRTFPGPIPMNVLQMWLGAPRNTAEHARTSHQGPPTCRSTGSGKRLVPP